jgi:HlyD family secretion protein
MKRGIVVLSTVAVLALAAVAYYFYAGGNGKAPQFRTATVENGDIEETITASGNINAVTTVQVGSQVSGTIRNILVDYNSVVKKGQVIAQIDPQLFQAAVVQARANLASTRASLEKAAILVADTERTLRRNRELLKDGFVAQSDVDAAQTAYDSAMAQQKSAEAQVTQATGALSTAETNLAYTTIHSPVNGVVISRSVDVGQTVAASFQTPTLFTIAQDLTKMQIDTNVDEADIGRAKTGLSATFTVDAYPGKTFEGAVVQVRNSPIVTQNVVTYDVVVHVDNKGLLLKPGMTANVTIHVQRLAGILKIPNAALRYRPSAADKEEKKGGPAGQRVYVLGKDGKPRPVPVKTGVSDGAFTHLQDGDLKTGDALVTGENGKKAAGRAAGGSPPGMGFR